MGAKPNKLTHDELVDLVTDLRGRVARLEAERTEDKATIVRQAKRIAELEGNLAAANKNSRNSSKPPSSDITSPSKAKRKRGKKRSIGG